MGPRGADLYLPGGAILASALVLHLTSLAGAPHLAAAEHLEASTHPTCPPRSGQSA